MIGEPLLSIQGLSVGYGRSDVVHDVDLAVVQGTTVSLIGTNGAGKTTLLRAVSGLLRPRSGAIRWRGRDIAGEPAYRVARSGIVHVPEGRQIFANMTVAENLAMGAYLVRNPAEIKQRRAAVIKRFPRLDERIDQQAGYLSGGEQQMLAMGRALMADPILLLLDEPSMGLAPLFVEEIFSIIGDLRAEGRTILLVEQNAQAALDICDRAYVIERGRITIQGTGAEVASNPAVASAYLGL